MASALATEPELPAPRSPRWPLTGRRAELAQCLAIVADPACRALLVSGPAGVGKSRLAEELLRTLAADGVAVARATATESARAIPLAALAHLLPPDVETLNLTNVVQSLRDATAAARPGGRLVLHVDDAHLLDATSAALLLPVLAAGSLVLVMTIRSGEAVPDAIEGLWRGDLAEIVELAELSRQSNDTLLHRSLGGPVDGQTAERLWETSRGNPLYLRELVAGTRASGALHEVDGVWRLDGPLNATDALRSLVLRRIARVPRGSRAILDALSVVDSIGRADVVDDGDTELEELEAAGLVAVRPSARRLEIVLAHPIHGELLRGALTHSQTREICRASIARITAHGSRRRGDALRLATWSLDADGTAPLPVLLRAVQMARAAHDFAAVERLGRAALMEHDGAGTAHLVAEALYELGGWHEAEQLLAQAERSSPTDRERLLIGVTRAANLFWGLARPTDALAANARAAAELTGDDRDELTAHRASMLLFSGRPDEALRAVAAIAQSSSDRVRAAACLVLAPALAMTGQTTDAAAALWDRDGDGVANLAIAHPGRNSLNTVLVLTESGRLSEAWTLAIASNDRATRDRNAIAQIWFAWLLGRIALLQGRPATARDWFVHQIAHCRSLGHRLPERVGQAGLAIAAAYLDDPMTADSAVAVMSSPETSWFDLFGGDVARGHAWALVARGEPARARGDLGSKSEQLIAAGNIHQAAAVLHDLSRLGGSAATALAPLAQRSDSALVQAFLLHVKGRESNDAGLLAEAAAAFEAMGALLYAAEASAGLAAAAARNGDQRQATAAARRVTELRNSLEGSRTPALALAGGVSPLSAREHEIASLAAAGAASKAIADRLFVSVRTVDNHLQTVYRKLGVSSRAQLSAALATGGQVHA